MNAQSGQVTLKRLDLAFKAFFRRVKSGEKPGFPRFKSVQRYPGWGYKTHGDGWRFHHGEKKHGRLYLQGIGTVPVRGKARTPGTPKTCEIVHRHGKWYASITINCEPQRESGTKVVAFDWGVEAFLTLLTGEEALSKVPNPRHLRNQLEALRALSKVISRKIVMAQKQSGRKKGFPVSNRLKKLFTQLNALHGRIANQRHDFLHQVSKWMIQEFGLIAFEELNIKKMVASGGARKRGLNREILSSSGGAFHEMVRYKAEEAGTWLMEAPTKELKPTQRCHACWQAVKKKLSDRWHNCGCGASCSRDENAVRTVMRWVEEVLASEGSGTGPARSGRCLAVLKRETHAIA